MIPLTIAEEIRTNIVGSNNVKVACHFTSVRREEDVQVTWAFFEKQLKEDGKGETN
jgi:hypothetical protein